MGTVELLFCRTRHPATTLIRAVTWGPWGHVALIMGDEPGCVIDATFTHGVARRNLQLILDSCSKAERVAIPCPNPAAAYNFARSQLGKPYDLRGALGLALHRSWQEDDAWWCSEFAEAAVAAGGNRRFSSRYSGRITPQHSYMLDAGTPVVLV